MLIQSGLHEDPVLCHDSFPPKAGSLKMNTALEYSTRVVQEGGRRCKKITLNDLVHLTPLRIPLMNPPLVSCINIYSCATNMCLNKLKLKHKKSTRTICNAGYRDHTAPLFAQLKIFPLSQLIKYSTLTFMHSFAHNMLPFSFCQMWTTTNRDHNPDHGFRNADYIPQHIYASLKKYSLVQFP
jgi:hypothetical protein